VMAAVVCAMSEVVSLRCRLRVNCKKYIHNNGITLVCSSLFYRPIVKFKKKNLITGVVLCAINKINKLTNDPDCGHDTCNTRVKSSRAACYCQLIFFVYLCVSFFLFI